MAPLECKQDIMTTTSKTTFPRKLILAAGMGLLVLSLRIATHTRSMPQKTAARVLFRNSFAAEQDAGERKMQFLANRVRRDREDFVACNMLAGCYLQQVRQTGRAGLSGTRPAPRAGLTRLGAFRNEYQRACHACAGGVRGA